MGQHIASISGNMMENNPNKLIAVKNFIFEDCSVAKDNLMAMESLFILENWNINSAGLLKEVCAM